MKHVNLLNGLEFLIGIEPLRGSGGAVVGTLYDKDTREAVFESDFPTYKDAYWTMMELDANAWLGAQSLPLA